MDKCKCDWGPRVWWDPPLCEGGGGFDGLLAPEKKFGKRLTRPPAKGEEQEYLHLWSDHHVSPHHSRVSKDEFLQRLHLLGFSPWSAHRVWWISCAREKISPRKEFDPLALWKKNAIMLMLMRMMIMRRVYDTCQSSLHPPRPCYRCTLLTFPRQPKVEGRFFWRYFPDLFLLILNLFWVNPNDMKWKW